MRGVLTPYVAALRERARYPLEVGGPPEVGHRRPAPPLRSLWHRLLRGGYPELAAHPKRDAALWHGSYIQTYLERDVRVLRQVGDLTLFQVFLRTLAARSGQFLNLTDLARDLGVAVNTAKAWLSVLGATHQVRILRPYFANVGKRLVKTPKVYFTDTGVLCFLAGLRDEAHTAAGPMAGAILETAVLAELVKALGRRGLDPEVYFWRTSTGVEVDFVVDTGSLLVPIEVKASATPRPAMVAGIGTFREMVGAKAASGYLVHAGEVACRSPRASHLCRSRSSSQAATRWLTPLRSWGGPPVLQRATDDLLRSDRIRLGTETLRGGI